MDKTKKETNDDNHLGFIFTGLNFKTKKPRFVAVVRKASNVSSDLLWTVLGVLSQFVALE